MQPSTPSSAPVPPVVLIVDDDVSVRESLESLARWAGWQAQSFSTAQDFLSSAAVDAPHCLVLDVSLPDLNGLDLQERVVAARPDMPIIFITGYGDIPMTVRAMKAGAAEFLTKPFERDAMLTAIRAGLARSQEYRALAADLAVLRDCYASLTRREREVFAGVAAGLLNKQVGADLGMTEATVKAHRGQVMKKMRADSLADLVRFAGRLGLRSDSQRLSAR